MNVSHITTYTYTNGAVAACPGGTPTDLYRTAMQRGGTGSVQQNWSFEHNCYSGMQTAITDANSFRTDITYDRYSRPDTITEGSLRKTKRYYNDSSRWIVTLDDAATALDQASVNVYRFDQLGRIRLTQQLETTTGYAAAGADETLGIQVKTAYQFDSGSSDVLVSNPFRQSDPATAKGWTVSRRDTAGRPCATETFDGSAVPSLAASCGASSGTNGRTAYTYDATVNWTKTRLADPAGATRDLYSDALGRMIAAVEDPASLSYATYYGYNVRDNLVSARQANTCAADPVLAPCTGGLSRSFAYTSLNRLASATNPESGTTDYGYDFTGNLVKRKMGTQLRCAGAINGTDCDATAYASGYDDLNRITSQNYSDANTPTATFTYDTANSANQPGSCAVNGGQGPIGRLASVANSRSANYYYYDKLGYIECNRQQTDGNNPFDFTYALTPQGQRKQVVYPTGRTITGTIDNAGRLTALCGAATCTSSYYAGDGSNPVTYAAHGAVAQMKLGNGLFETSTYNGRLQLVDRTLGITPGSSSVWRLQNGFATTQNNGNVVSQTETVPGWGSAIGTQYRYDGLNRLSLASENPSSSTTPSCPDASSRWCEKFSYDWRGNRLIPSRDGIGVAVNEPGAFGAATNQVTGTNWHFDARGNMDESPGGAGPVTFLYDGENHQIAYCPNDAVPANCSYSTSNGRTVYLYDGQGRRVNQSDATTSTTFAYDADGQLAAEYGGSGAPGGTTYLTDDHLGSTRVVTDAGQNIVTRRDYLPFGEEMLANARNGRSAVTGYSADGGVKVKFTGKERDAESGLDYFGARYFSSAQGRWTSPDEPFADQHPEDPQSWNLYGYVRNNPLKNTDPDGRGCFDGVSSCLNFLVGVAKGAVNTGTSGIVNAPNRLTNALIAPFTSYRFGDIVPDTFQAANFDQQQGMESVTGAMLVSPLAEAGAAAAVDAMGTATRVEAGTAAVTDVPTSIPAGPSARPTAAQQRAINEMGEAHGCSTCGATTPGTKTGNWVGDHQPPTALNPPGGSQVYQPQCLQCSRQQGGQVAAEGRAAKKATTCTTDSNGTTTCK